MGDVFLAKKYSGTFSGKADAETMLVIIADMPAQLLPACQDYRDFGVRLHQRFKIGGFRSRMLRFRLFPVVWKMAGWLVKELLFVFESMLFEKGHLGPAKTVRILSGMYENRSPLSIVQTTGAQPLPLSHNSRSCLAEEYNSHRRRPAI